MRKPEKSPSKVIPRSDYRIMEVAEALGINTDQIYSIHKDPGRPEVSCLWSEIPGQVSQIQGARFVRDSDNILICTWRGEIDEH